MESVKFATSGQKYGRKRSVRSLISFWFFGHDFFQERTSKPKIIVFGHQEHLNGSFCVVFIFHASLIWSVRYSNKTAKNDKSGMVTLLFEGSAYNTSRYFAHCSCFSSTLWGSRNLQNVPAYYSIIYWHFQFITHTVLPWLFPVGFKKSRCFPLPRKTKLNVIFLPVKK